MSREVMEQTQCQHVWRHLETVRWTENDGGYNTRFIRIDRYWCEKCLATEDKKQDGLSRDTPDWYRTGVKT
jgi:hypothetical protein